MVTNGTDIFEATRECIGFGCRYWVVLFRNGSHYPLIGVQIMKTIFITAVLAAIGFLGWKNYTKAPPTPLENAENCLQQSSIPSTELARICNEFPTLVSARLKNRKITVTGMLKKALVKGVDRRDLILEMEGAGKRNVTFTSDAVSSKRLRGVPADSLFRFQKHGSEIYVEQLSKAPEKNESASKAPSSKMETVIAFREGDQTALEGIFLYIRPGSVELDWIQPSGF